MSRRVCLILIDGLRADTARTECVFLMASVDAGDARAAIMLACLPTISAPLYETIHTGMSPAEHGLLSNEAIRPSLHPNMFSELKAAGKVSAAVAHSYFHTLYGGSAFDPFQHVEISDPAAPIPHARYYSMEGSDRANPALPSEIDLCAQAWAIASGVSPDYLLLHTSSCDEIGHQYTSEGCEYRVQARRVDTALSQLVPRLRGAGYDVVVTADHSINADGHHGGDEACLREVPFIAFSDALEFGANDRLDQRIIAPTMLRLMGLEPPDTMTAGALL